MDQQEVDKQIRSRAYEIWEHEGRPDGEHERHWRQASEEFQAGLAASETAVTDLPQDSQGIASDLQRGGVIAGGGPGRSADSIGAAGKSARGKKGAP